MCDEGQGGSGSPSITDKWWSLFRLSYRHIVQLLAIAWSVETELEIPYSCSVKYNEKDVYSKPYIPASIRFFVARKSIRYGPVTSNISFSLAPMQHITVEALPNADLICSGFSKSHSTSSSFSIAGLQTNGIMLFAVGASLLSYHIIRI